MTPCMRTACPHPAAYAVTSEVYGIDVVLYLCVGHTARARAVWSDEIKSLRSLPREATR